MALLEVFTDENLQDILPHGTPDYPMAVHMTNLAQYVERRLEWHWHEYVEFTLVLSGEVICRCSGDSICLHAGDGVFLNSGVLHRFETETDSMLVSTLFSPEFISPRGSLIFNRYVEPCLKNGKAYLELRREDGRCTDCLRILERVRECAASDVPIKALRLRNHISALWELMSPRILGTEEEEEPRQGTVENTRLLTMAEYIASHYMDRITLADISASASISQSEALRCFHVGMQTTPVRYLNEYRLSRAKEKLLSTNSSVTAIAEQSGFESAGYFCRVFKGNVGCTPAEYRRRNRL